MAILSRTYASSNILHEESKPLTGRLPLADPPTLILRESAPLSPTQACYPSPGKLLKPSKCKTSLFRKTLMSYLKKTKQGRNLLRSIREQRTIPQVSNILLKFTRAYSNIQFQSLKEAASKA